jgi:hypothetical protein
MRHNWTKNAFWDVNNKKWRKWRKCVSPFLFNNSYDLPVLTIDTKIPNQVFYVRLSIYSPFVLNRKWKHDSLQMIIFVNVCSTWRIVELKTCFETWIRRKDVNGVSLFDLCYLKHIWLTCVHNGLQMSKSIFYVWLFDLKAICAKYGLESWFTPNDDIRKCLLEMNHASTKNAFWDVSNKKLRKWCKFV